MLIHIPLFHPSKHYSYWGNSKPMLVLSIHAWMKLKYKKYLLWVRYLRKNKGRSDKEIEPG